MAGLEQYAIPYDPQAQHQLHWTPGNHGKGLVTPEGIIHHWNVSGPDGQPQHRRYVRESPAFGWDPYGAPEGKTRDAMRPFWIRPEGSIFMLDPRSRYDDILATDPRLTPPDTDDSWRFADFRNQQRAIDVGPPKIVSEYPDASPEAIEAYDYNARRPFIYHAPTNTAYVGRPGTHHHDILKEYGVGGDDVGEGVYEGYIMKGYPSIEGDSAYPDQAAWFHHAPDNHEEVLDAIAKRQGVAPAHYTPEEWHFAAAPVPLIPTCNHCGSTNLSPPRALGYKLVQTCENCGRTQLTGGTKFADLDERARQKAADPLGFERTHDWDQPGDVQRGNPDIEWVPTHELKKFMEYDRRPGGKDAWSDNERWNALGQHLKTQGFKNPIWLDFNPDTGAAHMSEGNHRVQIALDHGIPAVPTRVYRSTRTSPTQIPVNPQPLSEWEDSFDPTGYHYPQYMRPSQIGLPIVPPPDQHTASYNNNGKWAWIEGMDPRRWRDSEYGDHDETYALKPHYEQLIDMARQHPQLAANFQHEIPWSDYNDITQRLDNSGLKWAVGTHGDEGATTFISGPTVREGDVQNALGVPAQPFRAWGDPANAYENTRDWHFGAVTQGQTPAQLGVYGNDPSMHWMERMPAIWSEDHGQWFVGQPGTHHADVIKEFGLPPESIGDWAEISLEDHHVDAPSQMDPELLGELRDWASKTFGKSFQMAETGWQF